MKTACEEIAVETRSAEETERLGGVVVGLLPQGSVVALQGELASGKTCFVRGMAERLGEGSGVRSPTFTLVNEYPTTPTLYHMDLYRLGGAEEVADLGYAELFDSEGICAVEWSERARALLPEKRLDIFFEHAPEDHRDARRIVFRSRGLLEEGWQQRIIEATDRRGPTT